MKKALIIFCLALTVVGAKAQYVMYTSQQIAAWSIAELYIPTQEEPISVFVRTAPADTSTTNEGLLSVGAGSSTTSTISSNTTGSPTVTLAAGTNATISENTGTNTITFGFTVPDLGGTYWKLGGNDGTNTLGSNTGSVHFESDNTRRMTIPEAGIAVTTTSTKALVLSNADSLGYKVLSQGAWTNTVTQSGSDTLLNSATGYGHLHRIGEIIFFTLRIEVALTNTGNTNTVYINPPVASNFAQTASDVIGTATIDAQGLSNSNIPQQRCLVFASTSDDKIGVSFDPPASLSYPQNRVYISVNGSYIVQP